MKIRKKRRSGSGIAQEPSTRDVVCWSAAILLPAAIYFSAAADLPHVLVITCLLLLFSSITRTGWRVTDRTTVYTVVFVGILTMFGNYLAPMKLDRFGFMAIFSRPMLLVPFSLYLAAMIAGFRNRGHVVGAAAAAALLCFGLGGDLRFERITPERFPKVDVIFHHFQWVYWILMGWTGVCVLFASRSGGLRGRWWRGMLLLLALSGIAVMLGLEYRFYRRHEGMIRNWENALLRIGIRQFYRAGATGHQLGGAPDLMAPLSEEFLKNSDQVVLRATAAQAPGYLRGRVFLRYERGSWSYPEAVTKELSSTLAADVSSTDQLYGIKRMTPTRNPVVVYPKYSFLNSQLLIPGDTASLELIALRVGITQDGQIDAEGFERDGGYTAYSDAPDGFSAYPEPQKINFNYLLVPNSLMPALRNIVEELKLYSLPSDAARMMALKRFFAENFEYSLDWAGPPSLADPENAPNSGPGARPARPARPAPPASKPAAAPAAGARPKSAGIERKKAQARDAAEKRRQNEKKALPVISKMLRSLAASQSAESLFYSIAVPGAAALTGFSPPRVSYSEDGRLVPHPAARWRFRSRRADPVEYFLTQHRRGHCELFASALVLLLREAGIPARYVTGVVCFEQHPSGKYYLSRLSNVHAWVEAYDRERKQWVLLDATPPRVNEAPPPRAAGIRGEWEAFLDRIGFLWQELMSDIRRGRFGDGIVRLVLVAWDFLWALLTSWWSAPLIWIVVIGGICHRILRHRRYARSLPAERRRIQKEFLARIKEFRRLGLISESMREPTASEILERVEHTATLSHRRREEAARFLREYLDRRYRP